MTLIDVVAEGSKSSEQECLHRILAWLESVVQEYVGILSQTVINKMIECLADFPTHKINVRDKYKLCGLLWSIGEKHHTQVLGRLAQKLE